MKDRKSNAFPGENIGNIFLGIMEEYTRFFLFCCSMKKMEGRAGISPVAKALYRSLLRLAIQYAPKKAKKILKDINKQDQKISKLVSKISKN